MIDTDKYEGHTPAPWHVEEGDMERYGEADTVLSVDGNEVARGVMRQDAQLIADAPLLLEEVKRLRAWKKLVSDIVQQQDGPHLREMLKEMIE